MIRPSSCILPLSLPSRDTAQMQGRCRGDAGEMRGRCGGDAGEVRGRCGGDAEEVRRKRRPGKMR